MAQNPADPYGACNFLVICDRFGDPTLPGAGFSEVMGLSMEVEAREYRSGGDKQDHVRKIPGLSKVGDVTLKRGIVGRTDMFQWISDIASGQPARSNVTIQLLDEQHQVVMTWKLLNAFPVKYTGPHLIATTNEVAIEELVLASESLTMQHP